MKRQNAIIAAVVGIIIVIAAAGGAILLMNPGSNPSSNNQGGASDNVLPSGPTGSVSGALVSTVGTNDTNASDVAGLQEQFTAASNSSESPDTLAQVAVSNNQTTNITLDCHNFTAKLDNGSSVQALNRANITVQVNMTVFIVLGFMCHGTNITSVNYSDGSLSFTIPWTKVPMTTLSPPVFRSAPTGVLNATDNLTFSALEAWMVEKGMFSPMPLRTDNQSALLVLVSGTNNNTTAVSLKASDFWLDLGNGTWVQGEDRVNNNVPKSLAPNTTVPFLIGFRGVGETNPSAMYYWPGNGTTGDKIALTVTPPPQDGAHVAVWQVWDNYTGAGMMANATIGGAENQSRPVAVQLLVTGNDTSAVNADGITAWTLRHGELNGTPVQGMDPNLSTDNGRAITVTFDVPSGDTLTMLSYQSGGSNHYVWLRPLMPLT